MTLARVVPSADYWTQVDILEAHGMSRAAAREVADDIEPPHLPADSPVRALLAWIGTHAKETP